MEITASLVSSRLEPLAGTSVATAPSAAATQQFATLMQAPVVEASAIEAAAAAAAGATASAAAGNVDSLRNVGNFDNVEQSNKDSNRDGSKDSNRDGSKDSNRDGSRDGSRDDRNASVGDQILNGMQNVSDEFRNTWKLVSETLRSDNQEISMQQMLSLQLHLTQASVQYDLLGKAVSRSTQNFDQLVRVQ